MKTNRFLLVASISLALALTLSCSGDGGGDENYNTINCQLSNGNCITSLNTNEQCYEAGGQVVQLCLDDYEPSSSSRSSSSSRPSSSSTTPIQTANAVILTLTSWETKDTDVGGLDPKIHFNVKAYQNKSVVSNNNSSVLLDEQDIGPSWSGSKRSSAIPFVPQADSLVIRAVVLEKDTFSDDDISPGYYVVWRTVPPAGTSGSDVMDYGSGKSKVGYRYEFIRQ